ncbi:UvrD-helicase domain-containing protein [Ralstonia wenshanensis]|uniref:UvrD-helicase domain-containing protein n=1 Tax=Ralstonia wenshanensis TaxID=2842456 RepID=UPI0021B22AE4|nr:UvrD-helicase domain-containing protein [Ralstonia wenshanensis]MCT7307125.1 UvrD-helicase domain-containing protein [Ralstonia wenshanensis]
MANSVTLAVAGSRKTQGIADHCATLPRDRRALVVTYTQANQEELRRRIGRFAGDHQGIEVMGWFTFLLRHFAKPFLPFKFPGRRVRGFNFDGRPPMMAGGIKRFLDANDAVYACELGRLANELIQASGGALLRRLEALYDEILIDEVQDLSAHDWGIIDCLLDSTVVVRMVGDIRQSVLATNPRSKKNKQYAYAEAIHWFREREKQGKLTIEESVVTWRCHPDIAAFSDTIFDAGWAFPATQSQNRIVTDHDGVFLLRTKHVAEYVERFSPQCLRSMAGSGKGLPLNFINFKVAKGATYERVLIVPTAGIQNFVRKGLKLEPGPAASFYVAITRAAQSVAIVIDDGGQSTLPFWTP